MKKDLATMFRNIKMQSGEPGDLLGMLKRLGAISQAHFDADISVIFAINPVTNTFLREQPTIVGRLDKVTLEDFKIPRENGLAKQVLFEKFLFIEDAEIRKFTSPITEAEKIRAFTAFGLFTGRLQKPLAVIYLDYRKPKKFSISYKTDLKSFAEFASSELQNTWFVRRYREIIKTGQEINETLENIDRMFDRVLQHIKGILDVSYYFSLAKYNIHQNDVDLYLVEHGKKEGTRKNYPLNNSISSWVITNLKTLKIDNLDEQELPNGVEAKHIEGTGSEEKSLIFVPLKIVDRPLGVISVQHPDPGHYDNEDRQILELLANHISLAINNNRLLDDLRKVDKSGQLLTQKLDSDQDVVSEVMEFIKSATQADLVILYPYDQVKTEYLEPIFRGIILSQASTGVAQPNLSTLVHLINLREESVFADDSITLYTKLGMDYSSDRFSARENIQSIAAIPLKVGIEPIGVLFVNFRNRQIFDDAQKWVISSLATYAAIAIRNSRHFREFRLRRLKELQDLNRIDRIIGQILDRDKILQTILELTTKHIKADTGVILLHNKKLNAVEAKAAIGKNLHPLEQQVYPLDQFKGIAKEAFKRKVTIRIDNVRIDSEWKDMFNEISSGTISEMDVPLVLGNEAIGVMNFESSLNAAFSADDQNFVETLAGQAVIAIKNAIEYERAQRVATERQALIAIVNTLLLPTNQREIFSIILAKALEITETNRGTISMCDEDKREIKIAVGSGLKDQWKNIQSFSEGIVGRAVREKRTIRINKLSTNPLREEFLEAFPGNIESELVVPIVDGAKVVGVINLESENPYHFGNGDTELIKSVASLCAVAIKNAESAHQKELAAVGVIVGDLSHKMNSPLELIERQIDLIEMNCQADLKQNTYLTDKLKRIRSTTADTIRLVQNTLDQAKHRLTVIEKTSLKFMLNNALNKITFPTEITLDDMVNTHKEPLDVFGTKELANVFHNLIMNSIHAMPDGGHINIYIESIDKDWTVLCVEDTGKGIPENVAPLVFQPITDKPEGHGFGLPLTKAYIEMIGGTITTPVPGRNGKGAKFTVHLRTYSGSQL